VGRIAIVGSGLAGLLTGILLARRGFEVTILEKDHDDLSSFAHGPWIRPGVGQASQTHAFLALSSEVLRDEAPDVLAIMEQRGVMDRTVSFDDENADGFAARSLFDSRLAYERVLREVASSEPLLQLRLGVTATSLQAVSHNAAPHVTGIEICASDGHKTLLNVDLTIDASGRRSQAGRMLREIGARPMIEEVHKCDFQYLTRWYQLNHDEEFPNGGTLVRGRTCFGGYLLCPASEKQFSISFTMSVHDPLRHVLRQGDAFDSFAMGVPRLAEWLQVAHPNAEPVPFGGIENRRRELVDGEGSIVTGFMLVGDAALHTNPTLGRGTSLAFKQAQFVARNINAALATPDRFTLDYAKWSREEIGYWFDSQVAADAELCDRLRALARGELLSPLSDEGRYGLAVQSLAKTDPVIANQSARIFHMLSKPSEAFGEEDIRRKIMDFLAAHPDLEEVREGLSRASVMAFGSG
jgi:2-polyprenyl-6-methoxyphenol hydroxylase-like FAD-dependent oxidoreductase